MRTNGGVRLAGEGVIKIGVAQFESVKDLEKNKSEILAFIDEATEQRCRLVVIQEAALDWSEETTRAEIDAAVREIQDRSRDRGIYVVLGIICRDSDKESGYNRGLAIGPDGGLLINYRKTHEFPPVFFVDGIRCNMAVCADRWLRELSDLPCLAQGSRIMIEISGGHGGDDGGPVLKWLRYRPWAQRNGAFVVLSSGVHHRERSFLGHQPWGGHSVILDPDGAFLARARYESRCLLTATVDSAAATRTEGIKRRSHPLMKPFWDAGDALLSGREVAMADPIVPYRAPEREITIAAAQMACSRNRGDNVREIAERIGEAGNHGARIVVFPELSVTGAEGDDIKAAGQADLERALLSICDAAATAKTHVVFGTPWMTDQGRVNAAFAVGPRGDILTRYDQINVTRTELFRGGQSTRRMWFRVDDVPAVLTIGTDSHWTELAELAAYRGAQLQFHLSYDPDTTADGAVVRAQRQILLVSFGTYSAVVNAADPSGLPRPSTSAAGGSMICKQGPSGHNKPDPGGVDLYLPYHASVITYGGTRPQMLYAARSTNAENSRYEEYNRLRRRLGWYGWIDVGMRLIESETG